MINPYRPHTMRHEIFNKISVLRVLQQTSVELTHIVTGEQSCVHSVRTTVFEVAKALDYSVRTTQVDGHLVVRRVR